MGDVVHIINNTSSGKGDNIGDDEDDLDGLSGSGDGDEFTSSVLTSRNPVRSSSRRPPTHGTNQDDLLIYIVAAAVVFTIAIIIIVAIIIYFRRRARARRARQKSHFSSQGSEMKPRTGNRETRVFGNIPGSDTMDLRRIEHQRAISRAQAPPDFTAPPPPKTRVAPEGEKLLQSGTGSQDRFQPELKSLLPPSPLASESTNLYEEIRYMAAAKTNESEDSHSLKENETVNTSSPNLENSNIIKDSNSHIYTTAEVKPVIVTKPKKSPRNIKVLKETPEGNQKRESIV